MPNDDLLKWTTSDVDFYSLLGLEDSNCSEADLKRAYRKTALKYHPDKLGKDFDPDKYELFQAANDVLSDAELKAKYDGHRTAKLQRQRANDLFEGKRRLMKEDLEARERGSSLGVKREREDDDANQMLRKFAEDGKKRRAKRQSMMGDSVAASSPAPSPNMRSPVPVPEQHKSSAEDLKEDELEKREREVTERIRDAEAARAKRKADKKARKSGAFVSADSPSLEVKTEVENVSATPMKRPDIFKGLKADDKSSASPKFSFSPASDTPQKTSFAATMARLKAAEKQRLEEQIRQQEAETAG